FVNPSETFPEDQFQFCCDQVALYDPLNDLMIWFLQYVQDGHQNIFRVAVAQGPQGISSQDWHFYDFSPKSVGNWDDEWFDFPDLALGKDFLYVSVNTFATKGTVTSNDDTFARAAIVRIPLSVLKQKGELGAEDVKVFSSEESFSLRPTQGARGGLMYFGGHDFSDFGGRIELFAWPESGTQVERKAMVVEDWSEEDYDSTGKDGNRWLNRADPRMTAAWASGDRIGFAWNAGRDRRFDEPHVRVAVAGLDGQKRPSRIVAQPHLSNPRFAYAYPAAGVTPDGTVGLAVCFGGGGRDQGRNPGIAVGLLNAGQGDQLTWDLVEVAEGTNGPSQAIWGDYLAVRPHGRQDNTLVATGFVLQGGTTVENVVPRFVHFSPAGTVSETGPDLQELRKQAVRIRDEVQKLIELIDRAGGTPGASPQPSPARPGAAPPASGAERQPGTSSSR
ncbi:MAG: hypothetical protein U0790_20250, partial [Isosphaeraceae bacterium]